MRESFGVLSAVLLTCVTTLQAFAAEPLVYRDTSTKEALYISDGPKVAYRGPKGGDPKPLILVSHENGDKLIKVKFRKSPAIWTLTITPDGNALTCESPGEPVQNFALLSRAKIAEMNSEYEKERAKKFIMVTSHENGGASYEGYVTLEGTIPPGVQAVDVEVTHGKTVLKPGTLSFAKSSESRSMWKDDAGTIHLPSEPNWSDDPKGCDLFRYKVSVDENSIAIGSNRFVFEATFEDDKTTKTEFRLSAHQYEGDMGKPVIYLYPTRPTDVSVRVEPKNGVRVSEPPYQGGWQVTAQPDGTLKNADGTQWPYLFWESGIKEKPAPLTEGFSVPKKAVPQFMKAQLSLLGLNQKEISDFMEFWEPRLTRKNYALIRFVPQSEIDEMAPLFIKPTPDSVIRVLIDFRASDAAVDLKPQTLTRAERSGFAVIEWGGLIYNQ